MRRNLILFILTLVCSSGAWAQMNFISEVKISAEAGGTENKQRLINDGFTVIDQDLNAHEGGRDIYIGYKTTTDPTKAITGLLIMESGSGVDVRLAQYKTTPITYRSKNYYRCDSYGSDYVDCDLNRKSGGADITLYYTKDGNTDDGGTPFTVLTAVGENKSMTGYLYTRHWIYGTDMYSTAENDVYGNTNEDNVICLTKSTHTLTPLRLTGQTMGIVARSPRSVHVAIAAPAMPPSPLRSRLPLPIVWMVSLPTRLRLLLTTRSLLTQRMCRIL